MMSLRHRCSRLKTIAWVVAHALRPDSITGSVMVLIPVDPALPIFGIGLRGQLTYDRCGRVSVGVGPAAGVGLGISGGVTADWVSPAGNFGGSVNANELQASEEGNAGGFWLYGTPTLGLTGNDNGHRHVFHGLRLRPDGRSLLPSGCRIGPPGFWMGV